MTGAVIELQGLGVSYGDVQALQHVRLSLRPGVVGLLGANGAGKSTLLGVMSGSVKPSAGTVKLNGQDRGRRGDQLRWREHLGVMPQHFQFPSRFTVRECLDYAAWLKRVPKTQRREAVAAAAELVHLTDRLHASMRSLSGGMRQRVGIGCSIVNRPRALLLDEPANGLDIEQRAMFRTIIRSLDPDALIVVSSHHAEDIASICQRIVVLDQGRIRFDGSITAFTQSSSSDAVTGAELEAAYLACVHDTTGAPS